MHNHVMHLAEGNLRNIGNDESLYLLLMGI